MVGLAYDKAFVLTSAVVLRSDMESYRVHLGINDYSSSLCALSLYAQHCCVPCSRYIRKQVGKSLRMKLTPELRLFYNDDIAQIYNVSLFLIRSSCGIPFSWGGLGTKKQLLALCVVD